MYESSEPMINHIPRFLDYCKEVGLSGHTYENYKHYLNKFILWLKKEYRLYLSSYKDNKKQSLKPITQNYYLIALRALLSYFSAKDVLSLPSDKITLLGGSKTEKTVKFLNLEQVEKLLLAPNLII